MRRQRELLESASSMLVALIGLAVVVATDGPVQIAAGAVAAIAAASGLILLQRQHRAEREVEQGSLLRFPARPVRDLNPEQVGVAPEADEALSGLGLDDGDLYVRRDVDADLEAALRDGLGLDADKTAFVVLSGPSKAGKTRSLFETMRRTMPDALLVAPKSFESIDELVKPGVLPTHGKGPTVLWLDDLEQFVRVEARGMRRAVLDDLAKRDERVIVLATAGGKGLQLAGDSGRFSVPMEDLLSQATRLRLESGLSHSELERLGGLAPAAIERIESEGIGAYMIAGRDLEQKLVSGSYPYGARPSPQGQAVAYTVIDWHRCGISDPIPREVLRDAYELHLPDSQDPSDEAFSEGLAWAREPLYSTVALITGREELKAYDYIVSFVERSSGRQIDKRLWDRFFEAATDEQAFALARVADEATSEEAVESGEPEKVRESQQWGEDTEQALERAASSGDDSLRGAALASLALVLADGGRWEEAKEAAQRAADAGNESAAITLAHRLREEGDEESEAALVREADEAGNPASALYNGVLLYRQGDFDAARKAFARAEAHRPGDRVGWVDVLPLVKPIIAAGPGLAGIAEEALTWAQDEGNELAGIALGHLYDQQGDREAGMEAMRISAERGDFLAAMKRFGMLEALGREEEALEARKLIEEITGEPMLPYPQDEG